MKLCTLSIDNLRTDGGTQSREEINMDTVHEYRDLWLAGVELPPLDVFYDGASYWIADGFHRFYGGKEANKTEFVCKAHQGTVEDARLFAAGSNAKHGLKRTNPDKRKSVEMVLAIRAEWSDARIAEHCGVSRELPASVRRQHADSACCDDTPASEPEVRIGRDGKKRKVKQTKKNPIAKETEPAAKEEAPKPTGKISGGTTFDVAEIEAAGEGLSVDERMKAESLELERWARSVMECMKAAPASKYLDQNRLAAIEANLRAAASTIRAIKGHAPCPKCHGEGCGKCRQTGWMNKIDFDSNQ